MSFLSLSLSLSLSLTLINTANPPKEARIVCERARERVSEIERERETQIFFGFELFPKNYFTKLELI